MKNARMILIGFALLAAALSAWANGQKEAQISGPPYNVATVMQIMASEELYQQGYLQREMDQNGDGVNDETGQRIYTGALRDFRDTDGDGLDDATRGELPFGLRNRLLDHNGDGIVDGTTEPVGQYVNRVRTEAQSRYAEGEGDQVRSRTRTRDQDQSRTSTQTMSSPGSYGQSPARNGSQGKGTAESKKTR